MKQAPRLLSLLSGLALTLSSGALVAQNYLHTRGSQIVDSQGQVVRLTGINWFGLETANYAPHGLWSNAMDFYLDIVKNQGYNCLRVPFCSQLFDAGSTPNGIDFHKNPDLVGLTGLQIMDKVIEGCKARGIKVILDRHRPDSGGQSALWYTSAYSEARWISDWKMLAQRYLGNDTVIGFDLHNEPHTPSTWGDGSATDWKAAAERCGNAVLSVNPNLLILVEGIEKYGSLGYWWGGELAGASDHPVVLHRPNQLVYSPHDYPSSLFPQVWFSDPSYPRNLPTVWDTHWGYLAKNNTAPILLGEFGSRLQTTSDQQWFQALADYIQQNGLSFTFWCLNPNSGDTGGLLADDWTTVIQSKQQVLARLQAPFIGSGPSVPSAPTGFTAKAGQSLVNLSWNASSGATSYNLYRGTTPGGEGSTPIASNLTETSFTNTGLANGTTYYYQVAALNSVGLSPLSVEVSATPQGLALPATPTGVKATPGDARITLTWNPSSSATSYNLYRGTTPGGEGSVPFATGITGTTYTNTSLTNGTTYYYKVVAVNEVGVSSPSSEVSATPQGNALPSIPTGLKATPGDGQITLTWNPSASAKSYNVYRGTTPGGEGSTPFASLIDGTTYTNTSLANGTTYYYKIAAVNEVGTSALSSEVSATPASQGSGPVAVSTAIASGSGPWWGELDVRITHSVSITAMTLDISLQKTTGLSYNGQYHTTGAQMIQTHRDTGSTLVYTFTMAPGHSLFPGSFLFAAQHGGTGTLHPTSGDTYTLTYTAEGKSHTVNGRF